MKTANCLGTWSSLVLGLALLCGGCESVAWLPLYADRTPGGPWPPLSSDESESFSERHARERYSDRTRSRIASPALRVLLFPVNLVPDMLSNAIVGYVIPIHESRYCCAYFVPFDFFIEGIAGIGDAWHGYPFWEPSVVCPGRYDFTCWVP